MSSSQAWHLGVGLVVLLGVGQLALWAGGVGGRRAPVVALLRGGVQLAVVAVVLRGALTHQLAVVAVLAVMLATAVHTASSRLSGLANARRAVLLACVVGALVTLGVAFAVPVLPRSARYVVALGGIVIGSTMTSATLAGRHLLAGLRARRTEVEGWLALGATPRQAVLDIARTAAGEALMPALDQTRTTGLVTLPGAFIGALLGGASPAEAARFQVVVLASLLCAQSVVAVLVVHLLGAPVRLPADI